MKKNITISDVAKQAEVSKTTISRYLNGQFGSMSAETKVRIAQVISDLNYRPNRQAQALKSKRSYLIGVIVSDISNMYSSLLLKGIGEVLEAAGYQMIIMDAANSVEKEQDLLHKLIDQSVEGIILQPSSRDASRYEFIQSEKIPLLLVDRGIEPLIYPFVTTDNEAATKKMLPFILEKNYQRVV
ncbi:MAG: LacI family DNA-binding transcriptional regulator, partial [Vagococcus sp.]